MAEEGVPKLKAYIADYMTSCPLCSNDPNDGRTLDCLHVCCAACLDDHIAATQQDGK